MWLLVIAALVGGLNAIHFIPPVAIPNHPPGIQMTASSDARITVEVMLDLNCPDSARAWEVMKQLKGHFGSERIQIVLHPFPLPYYPFSFLCAQGLYAVQDLNSSQTENYLDAVFDNMGRFSPRSVQYRSNYDMLNYLAHIAQTSTGIPSMMFKSQTSATKRKAITHWKFAARRSVAGTPWYFINGVELGLHPHISLSLFDWISILSDMIREDGDSD